MTRKRANTTKKFAVRGRGRGRGNKDVPSSPSAQPTESPFEQNNKTDRVPSRSPSACTSKASSNGSVSSSVTSVAASVASTSFQSRIKKKRAKKTQFTLDSEEEQLMCDSLRDNPMIWDIKKNDYRKVDKKAKLLEDQANLMGKLVQHLQGCSSISSMM